MTGTHDDGAISLGDGSRRARTVGLPDLVDAPELAGLLADLEALDGLQARIVARLARLHDSHESECATLLPVETWLLAAGVTRSDRRMLDTAVTQLGRLPSVAAAFVAGVLTWPQVRAVCLKVARLSDELAAEADRELAPLLDRQVDRDPDEVAVIVDELVAALAPTERIAEVERAEAGRFLSFQPRLDGTGARVYGDLDGAGYGLVSTALDAGLPLAARRGEIGATGEPGARRTFAAAAAAHRADRLVQLATDDLARRTGQALDPGRPLAADGPVTTPSPDTAALAPETTASAAPARTGAADIDRTRAISPQVTLLLTVDQLLGDDALPVDLLAPVTGGRVKVASATARRWVDDAGGRLRTIVLDDTGRTLGVGRARRLATGWLRDAIEATHATCAAPGCHISVRICDSDHHTRWSGDDAGRRGRTDLDQLGPLCRACHSAKERGWTITVQPDGTRRWHHPRSGLAIHTTPHTHLDAPARRRRGQVHERPSRPPPDSRPDRNGSGPARGHPRHGGREPPTGPTPEGRDPPVPF